MIQFRIAYRFVVHFIGKPVLLAVVLQGCVKIGSDVVPSRPKSVPASAFWLSGRELTGRWIDIRNVENNAFTADVYFESGEMWMADRFVAPTNRLSSPITEQWLKKHIIAPNGYDIIVLDNGKELAFKGSKGPLAPTDQRRR